MKRLTLLLVAAVTNIVAPAQTTTGPVLGWHVDPDSQVVRAILGIPGASRMVIAPAVPSDIRLILMSPAASLAAALQGDSRWPVLYDLASGVRTTLNGGRAQPTVAVWSSSGTAFGLLYPNQQWVQLFANRNGRFELVTELATAATRVAVADDGSAILDGVRYGSVPAERRRDSARKPEVQSGHSYSLRYDHAGVYASCLGCG